MSCQTCKDRKIRMDANGDFVLCRDCPPCIHGISGACYECVAENSTACRHHVKGYCPDCIDEREAELNAAEEERTKHLRQHDWSDYTRKQY